MTNDALNDSINETSFRRCCFIANNKFASNNQLEIQVIKDNTFKFKKTTFQKKC